MFGISLVDFISAIGVVGLMAVVFAESGLLLGFFLPGDTLLFAAGLLATRSVFSVNVHMLVALLFIAAVLGDTIGYVLGQHVGSKLFKRQDSLLFHQDNLRRAQAFYKRFGAMTVLLARFVPVVRTFVPVLAGVGRMEYRTFLIFNLGGGLLWTAGVTYLGYFAGAFFEAHGINIDNLLLPIIALIILLTLLSPLYHILQGPKGRAMMLRYLRLKNTNVK